jgi:hypothetical protein
MWKSFEWYAELLLPFISPTGEGHLQGRQQLQIIKLKPNCGETFSD